MLISIASTVKNSLIDNTPLSGIPKVLREKVLAVLSFMSTAGIHQIVNLTSRSTTNATLSRGGGFIRMDAFMSKHPERVAEIAEALQLLVWYIEPKFHGEDDGKASKLCNSCGEASSISAERCADVRCYSHAHWRQVEVSAQKKKKVKVKKVSKNSLK